MEIHQLRYFCAAAETGSFTRGAHKEHVTQPTLSQQLQKLENELVTKLFDRRQHRIQLTDSGRTFLRSAKLILVQLDQATREIRGSSTDSSGSIRIGSTPTLTQFLLSPIVRRFRRTHPAIKVHITEDIQSRLLDPLRSGLLDVALVHLPISGREFRTQNVVQQSLYAALPKNHVLAERKHLRLTQLRNESFLLLREGLRFGSIIREILRHALIDPEVAFEGSSIENILAMVSAGAGISLVPEVAAVKRAGCSYVPVKGSQRTGVGWAMLRDHSLSRALRLFMQTVASSRRMCRNGAEA